MIIKFRSDFILNFEIKPLSSPFKKDNDGEGNKFSRIKNKKGHESLTPTIKIRDIDPQVVFRMACSSSPFVRIP